MGRQLVVGPGGPAIATVMRETAEYVAEAQDPLLDVGVSLPCLVAFDEGLQRLGVVPRFVPPQALVDADVILQPLDRLGQAVARLQLVGLAVPFQRLGVVPRRYRQVTLGNTGVILGASKGWLGKNGAQTHQQGNEDAQQLMHYPHIINVGGESVKERGKAKRA